MAATSSDPATAANLVDTILAEGPLGMAAIARLCGSYRAGKPTHPATPTRWATAGVTLADGSVLKLEAIRLNNRWVSSRQRFAAFLAAQQGQPAFGNAPDHVRLPSARRKASDRAAAQLQAMGC